MEKNLHNFVPFIKFIETLKVSKILVLKFFNRIIVEKDLNEAFKNPKKFWHYSKTWISSLLFYIFLSLYNQTILNKQNLCKILVVYSYMKSSHSKVK